MFRWRSAALVVVVVLFAGACDPWVQLGLASDDPPHRLTDPFFTFCGAADMLEESERGDPSSNPDVYAIELANHRHLLLETIRLAPPELQAATQTLRANLDLAELDFAASPERSVSAPAGTSADDILRYDDAKNAVFEHRAVNCRFIGWPFELDDDGRLRIPSVDELIEDGLEPPVAECAHPRMTEMSDEQLRRHDDWIEFVLAGCLLATGGS